MTTSTAVIPAVAGDGIEAAIRREHAAATSAATAALGHALECGRLLAEVREGIGHGGWETFVRERCDIAPRTARVYLRLHANRDQIANRQHVAGLTVREAVRVLTVPRVEAEPVAEVAAGGAADNAERWGVRLAVPKWYRPAHRHFGDHPAGWFFETWPHPAGDQWAHYYVCSPMSDFPGDESSTLVGPKRGIAVVALEWSIGMQTVNGMPSLDDAGWNISDLPCGPEDASDWTADRFKPYNSLLFRDEDDYRQRGMGIKPRRKTWQGAPA